MELPQKIKMKPRIEQTVQMLVEGYNQLVDYLKEHDESGRHVIPSQEPPKEKECDCKEPMLGAVIPPYCVKCEAFLNKELNLKILLTEYAQFYLKISRAIYPDTRVKEYEKRMSEIETIIRANLR